MELLSLDDEPLLKGSTGQRESREKVTPVQLYGLFEPLCTGSACRYLVVSVSFAGSNRLLKGDDIYPIVTVWV
jgi:hypothetical protein